MKLHYFIQHFRDWFEQIARLRQNQIYQYLNDRHAVHIKGSTIVTVQCVEDLLYYGLFGQIIASLREKQPVCAEMFVPRSLNVGEGDSLLTFMYRRLINNLFQNIIWERLYGVFCDNVAYRSTSFHPLADLIDLYRAFVSWQHLTDKESFISMQIDGVPVGDLINDSFLRFKPAPIVDLKDTYVLVLIWQAYLDVRRARNYFSRVKPKLYLTSYCTYIQHGVALRTALLCGVRVFSFANYQEFAKELTLNDWVHTKNPDGYATEFLKLDRQDERLALAEAALSARLSGGVDGATAYMTKSAYAESGDPVPDVRGALVMFLHDFYDSPHVYREMVFHDFWEWVCFTIETLNNANIRFFLKPHPNQINLSDMVLDELKKRYPKLLLISSGVTNKQLAKAGMSCAVTVHGTVAHEMAYLGVPSIACGHNPHISFDFCRTARSRVEYANLLQNPTQSKIDKNKMHRQSLIFYYMHNLEGTQEMREMKDFIPTLRAACEKPGGEHDLVRVLNKMSLHTGYQTQVSKMIK